MSGDRLTQPEPRRLADDQGMPGDFLVAFTEGLMDRRQQLLGDGQPPETARQRAVAEAVQAFRTGAGERGWTVEERRIASLAGDTLGLEDEYRDRHGYPPEQARLYAVGEVLESERIRDEIPVPWWGEADPPGRPDPDLDREQRPPGPIRPDGYTDRAWTRESGRER